MSDKPDAPERSADGSKTVGADKEVIIRIEDLTPPDDVKGGRKILLGEWPTPPSVPRIDQ